MTSTLMELTSEDGRVLLINPHCLESAEAELGTTAIRTSSGDLHRVRQTMREVQDEHARVLAVGLA